VLVTPPLGAAEATALRSVFAGAQGVTEENATGEYTFGYTNAPESYDGFGTLSLSAEGDERLVGIRNEHLNWQVGRYASGLRRFRPVVASPVSPAPDATEPSREMATPAIGVGTVVHVRGRARRYVVVHVETFGEARRLSMIALSGSVRGCYPTAVSLEDVEPNADQTVAFTGAAAETLRRKYQETRRPEPDLKSAATVS
jgi:hypothetical protein